MDEQQDSTLWAHIFLQTAAWGVIFPLGMVLGVSIEYLGAARTQPCETHELTVAIPAHRWSSRDGTSRSRLSVL